METFELIIKKGDHSIFANAREARVALNFQDPIAGLAWNAKVGRSKWYYRKMGITTASVLGFDNEGVNELADMYCQYIHDKGFDTVFDLN